MHSGHDIIAAIATAPGRGGIGIVRLSGTDLSGIATAVLGSDYALRLRPRQALLAPFINADASVIDQGLALFFAAPHSYTGESVLELQGHGGPVVLRMVLDRCLAAGARLAEPGEFTLRAYLNGQLDLAQAEAVADLIDAGTTAAARGAMRSLEGGLSEHANQLGTELTELRALVEACLDFPEEDIEFLQTADAMGRLINVISRLGELQTRARQGALLREGVQLVIAGAPNVGKSSLLNALAQRDLAIVSEYAGTTRDRIECRIDIDGVIFNIVDTAGLRDTTDPIEQIGISRTHETLRHADLVLQLLDDSQSTPSPLQLPPDANGHARDPRSCLTVRNKIDLTGHAAGLHDKTLYVSARSGAGLSELRDELLRRSGWRTDLGDGDIWLARSRHLQALDAASVFLLVAKELGKGGPATLSHQLELFAENLRLAADALHSIAGAASADDLLGEIFSRFCIGK
jgi:tRNA modification GTPase